MLIDFTARNYLSFKDTATLSMMVPKSAASEPSRYSLATADPRIHRLSPLAAIFGANASGKTNFLQGIRDFRTMVMQSHSWGIDASIPCYRPFKLNPGTKTAPVAFEIECLADGIRYSFEVEFNRERILREELVSYPKGRRSLLYRRIADAPMEFGTRFIGKKRDLESMVRKNTLFISTAVYLKNEILLPLYKWFENNILFHFAMDSANTSLLPTTRRLRTEGESFKSLVLEFMNAADISVMDVGVRKQEEPLGSFQFPPDFPAKLRESILEDLSFQPMLGHAVYDDDGASVGTEYLSLKDEESGGTVKVYDVGGKIIAALQRGGVLIIDEFNSGLHPQLCEFLISLFKDPLRNPHGAQLVVTLHDTNFMASDLAYRDELWIVQRDAMGASDLYSLEEFSRDEVRKGTDLEKWYLNGRFRGVPSFDLSRLDAEALHAKA